MKTLLRTVGTLTLVASLAGCGQGVLETSQPGEAGGEGASWAAGMEGEGNGVLESELEATRFDMHELLADEDIVGGQHIVTEQVQAFLSKKGSALAAYVDPVSGKSAAALIVERSKVQGISPLYMLARLQTESSIVSSGTLRDLDKATGCGCPDTSPCAAQYRGFGNQVECGAKKIRDYWRDLDAGRTTVTGWKPGVTKNTSDPCSVTPRNKATAVLYTYTPWVGAYAAQCGRTNVGGSSLVARAYARFKAEHDWGMPAAPPPVATPNPTEPPSGAQCHSGTLARFVGTGVCVQSASDKVWRQCQNGLFNGFVEGSSPACTRSFGWCTSGTLGRAVPARTCVQASKDNVWYQCVEGGRWAAANAVPESGAGPEGACSEMFAR